MLKNIFGILLATIFALSGSASAMTFSQPVEIGWMGMDQKSGGFSCKNESQNNGDYYTVYKKDNKYSFGKGVASFGNGKKSLFVHYDVYKNRGLVKIGSSDINNTVQLNILNEWIYRIDNDADLNMFAIRFWYGPDSEWRIIGTSEDGRFVKYINTMDITEKYFGIDIRGGASPIRYDVPICNGDTIIIKYSGHKSKNNIGEFRFKWDDAAQWFGVEQAVY